MNKLEIYPNGGEPFVLDDLKFLEDANRQVITGLASFFNKIGDPIIISGLEDTTVGATVTFTAGYIYVNKEVFYVPAGSLSTAGDIGIDITETIDPNGDKVFENGLTYSAYKVRQGLLSPTIGSNWIDIADFRSVKQLIASYGFLINDEPSWIEVGSVGAAPFSSSWTNNTPGVIPTKARYRKNRIGEVEISGIVTIPNYTSGTTTIFQLPVGYRPTGDQGYILMGNDDSGITSHQVVVSANGTVKLFGAAATNKLVYLNPLRFTTI